MLARWPWTLFRYPLIFTDIRGCQPGISGCYLVIHGILQVSVDFHRYPWMLSMYPWMLGLRLHYLSVDISQLSLEFDR